MMNAIVVYSSQTGRIEQIAHAIAAGLPQGTPCVSVDDMPDDFSSYDCVFAGFWIDENQADPKGQEALKKIGNDHVPSLPRSTTIPIRIRPPSTCAVP